MSGSETKVPPFRLEKTPSVGDYDAPPPAVQLERDLDAPFMVESDAFLDAMQDFKVLGGSTPLEPQRAERQPFVEVEIDEFGRAVASDPFGAAIAVAPTAVEAVASWEEAAQEHYEDLAANEDHLHPRLHEQLLFLRKRFG